MTDSKNCCVKKGLLGILVILVGVIVFIVWHAQNQQTMKPSDRYGTWYDNPKPVEPFTLETTLGGTFTEQSLKGHWSWVFFGFTNCPDMCPNTMKAFKVSVDKLRQDKFQPFPQIILVSLDPQRDSLEVLKKYVTSFDPSFIGLKGNMEQVAAFAKQMNVSYKDMGNGMIQHSGTVTVVNPEGEIQAYFPWVDEPVKVAEDYEAMAKK
jgi:protein SCO1